MVADDIFRNRTQAKIVIEGMVSACRIEFIVFPISYIPHGADRVGGDRVRPVYFPEVGEVVGVQGDYQGIAVGPTGDRFEMIVIPVHTCLVADISGRG